MRFFLYHKVARGTRFFVAIILMAIKVLLRIVGETIDYPLDIVIVVGVRYR